MVQQLDLFVIPSSPPSSDIVSYLEESGFVGECSVVKNHMKTSANLFEASCTYHDICYSMGGTEDDRKVADTNFYRKCILNAAHAKDIKWIWYYVTVATVWYVAVRTFGWTSFTYGEYKTVERILELNLNHKDATLMYRLSMVPQHLSNICKSFICQKIRTIGMNFSQVYEKYKKALPKDK